MTKLPKKVHEVVCMSREGRSTAEMAAALNLKRETVRSYLFLAERAGLMRRQRVGLGYVPLKPIEGRTRQIGVRLSSDVAADLAAEAQRRGRPVGWVVSRIVTAALDADLVEGLLEDEGEHD